MPQTSDLHEGQHDADMLVASGDLLHLVHQHPVAARTARVARPLPTAPTHHLPAPAHRASVLTPGTQLPLPRVIDATRQVAHLLVVAAPARHLVVCGGEGVRLGLAHCAGVEGACRDQGCVPVLHFGEDGGHELFLLVRAPALQDAAQPDDISKNNKNYYIFIILL